MSDKIQIKLKCKRCGEVLEPDARFCHNCRCELNGGAACPQCNASVESDWKVCPECGIILDEEKRRKQTELERDAGYFDECGEKCSDSPPEPKPPQKPVYCQKCGKQVEVGVKACPACIGKGTPLTIASVVMVAVIVGLLLLYMGGGFLKKKEETQLAPEPVVSETKVSQPKDIQIQPTEAANINKSDKPEYHVLEPFIVNIYDGQELRYLKVNIELVVENPSASAKITRNIKPIRDAVVEELIKRTAQDLQGVQGKNNLRRDILSSVQKIIEPDKILNIYFTGLIIQ